MVESDVRNWPLEDVCQVLIENQNKPLVKIIRRLLTADQEFNARLSQYVEQRLEQR